MFFINYILILIPATFLLRISRRLLFTLHFSQCSFKRKTIAANTIYTNHLSNTIAFSTSLCQIVDKVAPIMNV